MCFSLEWLKEMLILAVVIIAIVLILQLIIRVVLAKLPAPFNEAANVIIQVLYIAIWAVVIIAAIIFVFMVISCLWSYAGGGSILPHGR